MVCTVQIDTVHHGGRLPPAPGGTTGNSRHHFQIPQQSGCSRLGLGQLLADLAAGFEKQRRFFENPGSHPGRAVAPGGIQRSRLAAGELVCGECAGHLFAVVQIGARHRHEKLHGHVRCDLPFPHFLLNRVREEFDQRQAPRNPTRAPVKAAGQFVQSIAKTLFEFRQQPALLQGGFALRCPQRLAEQKSLGFVHLPNRCTHRVTAQLSQRRYPLVPVDDQVAVRFVAHGYDHDRHLLARGRQRSQKSSLPVGASHSQVLESKIELVKLQIHGGCLAACREHRMKRRQCRCRRVTPCPGLRGLTHALAGSYRCKPARDGGLREKSLVHVFPGYLQAMQSVAGSRWAVTVPELCPRFGAQTSRDQRLVAASRRVTSRLIPSFLPAQPRLFSSSDGGGKHAAASAHRRDNPEGCAHGVPEQAGFVGDVDTQSSTSSER